MTRKDVKPSEYNQFYSGYLNMIPAETNLIMGFQDNLHAIQTFFNDIPQEKLEYKYDVDKWTVKEVFQHMIDCERVFQFRCFHIARHDKTPLPGFEENDYIASSKANTKSIETLIGEFTIVHKGFIALLQSVSIEDLMQISVVNGAPVSARALAFITLGHYKHHVNIIKQRYL